MVELVDTLALGASEPSSYRFESCLRHQESVSFGKRFFVIKSNHPDKTSEALYVIISATYLEIKMLFEVLDDKGNKKKNNLIRLMIIITICAFILAMLVEK